MSEKNPLNNPLPFQTESSINNPSDLYLKSSFNDIETLRDPYFERNFITIPKNDQDAFVNFLHSNPAQCRDTGYLCKVEKLNERTLNRVTFESEKYQSQFLSKNYKE